jgi:hypothetical protein
MFGHDADGAGQGSGQQVIVRRQDQVEIGGGPLDAFVIGGDVAPVHGVATKLDSFIGSGQGPADLGGVVGRAIIDHEDADGNTRLRKDSVHASGQVAAVLVTGYDDVHCPDGARAFHRLRGVFLDHCEALSPRGQLLAVWIS